MTVANITSLQVLAFIGIIALARYAVSAVRRAIPAPQHQPRIIAAPQAAVTQRLPLDWRPVGHVIDVIEAPAPSPAMRAASKAPTTPMPFVGRVGSRQWARSADACFGGAEVR